MCCGCQLLAPLIGHLETRQRTSKTTDAIQELLRRGALGLSHNASVCVPYALTYCHTLVEQNLNTTGAAVVSGQQNGDGTSQSKVGGACHET